jgi:hypothetical protein
VRRLGRRLLSAAGLSRSAALAAAARHLMEPAAGEERLLARSEDERGAAVTTR